MDKTKELVVRKDGEYLLSEKAASEINVIIKSLAELEEMKATATKMLLEQMEKYGIKKFENDDMLITYIAKTTREQFNKKKFREEHPDLHDEYIDFAEVRPSVRFKLK